MNEDKDTTQQPSEEFQRFDEAVDKLFGVTAKEVREADGEDNTTPSNQKYPHP